MSTVTEPIAPFAPPSNSASARGVSEVDGIDLPSTVRDGTAVLYVCELDTGAVCRAGALQSLTGDDVTTGDPTMQWWTERVHPDDALMYHAVLRRAHDAVGQVMDLEYRVRHRDGTWRPVSEQITSFGDEHGRAVRLVGLVSDATLVRSVETGLRRQSERFRRLANLTVAMNVAREIEDVVSVACEELVSLCGAQAVVVRVRTAETMIEREAVAPERRSTDHETFPEDVLSPPLRLTLTSRDGMRIGELEMSRDHRRFNSDEVAIAVQVAQTAAVAIENINLIEALREADRRKDRFLAILAHELRNPLTPIVNAVTMLERAAETHFGVARARETINRQSLQLVRLIDDLMDVSRVTQDRLELRRQRLVLREVLEIAFESVRPALVSKGLHLTVSMPSEGVILDADPARLAQVLTNILGNAVKYTDNDGDIRVVVTCQPEQVEILIADSGRGMSSAKLPHVFEMFTQRHDDRDRSGGGLGIGLALARRLILLHGGTITASSDGPGKGSTFQVTMPLVASTAAPTATSVASISTERPMSRPPASHGLAAGPRARVLVVDDNVDAADSLSLLLEREGHQVHVAYDGESAVSMHARLLPDAVIMDIGLPRLDGCDAARAMRQAEVRRTTLLVALTGWGQSEDRRRSLEAGFDLHLVKPVSPRTIHALVVEHILATSAGDRAP